MQNRKILENLQMMNLKNKFSEIIQQSLTNDLCIVDLKTQSMWINCVNGFNKTYLISTALNGANNHIDSNGTPLGKHVIVEKIGDNEPIYTIFRSRKIIGKLDLEFKDHLQQDLILTRILRLKGEEPGINQGFNADQICVDSYDRYIYIHGTNHENLLGQAVSKGCIRMGNQDIIELFANINVGAKVYIVNS